MDLLKSHERDLGGGLMVSRVLPGQPHQIDLGARHRALRARRPGAAQEHAPHVRHSVLGGAAELEAGATLTLPAEYEERGIYLVQGSILVDGTPLPERNLAFIASNEKIQMQARTQSRLMLLGGEKMDGPRFIWWNFVASSKEKIEAAKARWREQKFAAVPGETEFIPLPER